jgi:hypothetical protein
MADVFGFEENLSIGPSGQIGKHKPRSGEVVIEVYDEDGDLINLDTFNGVRPAPNTSCYISRDMFEDPWDRENGIAGTIVDHRDALRHVAMEWECPIDFDHLPFEIPQYIIDKPGATKMKIWWGA